MVYADDYFKCLLTTVYRSYYLYPTVKHLHRSKFSLILAHIKTITMTDYTAVALAEGFEEATSTKLQSEIEADPSKDKGVAKDDKYASLRIGEVDGFTVYKIPQGLKNLKQASCDLGSGTEWCTAHSGATYFEQYIDEGPLYIFDNGKGEKYQFHFESEQFMDKNDNSVV